VVILEMGRRAAKLPKTFPLKRKIRRNLRKANGEKQMDIANRNNARQTNGYGDENVSREAEENGCQMLVFSGTGIA